MREREKPKGETENWRGKKTTTEGVKIQFSDLKYERMLASFFFAHRRGKSNFILQSNVKIKVFQRERERERENIFYYDLCSCLCLLFISS